MREKARIAVVGTGWWATATHLPVLREHSYVEIAALCDVSPARVQAAAAAFGVERTYTDHRAMLAAERPDAVVVATTHATHFAVAADCLEAGADVLIEKPMTLLAADARALVERAEQLGHTLLLGYPWNYRPHSRQVREVLASGLLGPIQYVQSSFNSYNADLIAGRDRSHKGAYSVHGPGDVYSRKEHSGGGHGHLQITHSAGLLICVTGLRVHTVQARMANQGLPLDLIDVILVEFEGGALGVLSGDSNSFLPESRLTVGCANGGVRMDVFAGTTTIRAAGGEPEILPPADDSEMALAPIRNLIGVALGIEDPPYPAAEVGWRTVELLDAAYRSAESNGRPVELAELY